MDAMVEVAATWTTHTRDCGVSRTVPSARRNGVSADLVLCRGTAGLYCGNAVERRCAFRQRVCARVERCGNSPSTSPWAYDIATLYDCRDRIIYSGHGNRPDGGGQVMSGPGGVQTGGAGQGPLTARPARRAQSWDYDSPGNIKGFRDDLSEAEPAGDNTLWGTAHDGGDKATQRQKTVNGVPASAAVVLLSDELGNLAYDGRWHFEYDVLGRMIGAYRPSAVDPQVRGTLFARFGYNAMGQRVTAAYDVDGAPDSLGYPAGDGDLSNNPREVFAYDDKWQLVAVFNQGPVESGTGARPPPVLKERYVYHAAGMRGMSLSQGLDRVVKRERFAAPDAQGVQNLSDEVYYLQNRRGDVTELLGPDGQVIERVRYTVYGEAPPRRVNCVD